MDDALDRFTWRPGDLRAIDPAGRPLIQESDAEHLLLERMIAETPTEGPARLDELLALPSYGDRIDEIRTKIPDLRVLARRGDDLVYLLRGDTDQAVVIDARSGIVATGPADSLTPDAKWKPASPYDDPHEILALLPCRFQELPTELTGRTSEWE